MPNASADNSAKENGSEARPESGLHKESRAEQERAVGVREAKRVHTPAQGLSRQQAAARGANRAPPTKGPGCGGAPSASIVVSRLAGAGARRAGGMGQAGSVPRPSQLYLTDRWPDRQLASDPNQPQRPASQPSAARWGVWANPGIFLWAPMKGSVQTGPPWGLPRMSTGPHPASDRGAAASVLNAARLDDAAMCAGAFAPADLNETESRSVIVVLYTRAPR